MIKQLNIAVCLACIAAIGAKSVSLKVKDGETADHQLDSECKLHKNCLIMFSSLLWLNREASNNWRYFTEFLTV